MNNSEEQKKLIKAVIDELKNRLGSTEGPERGETLLNFDLGNKLFNPIDEWEPEFWDRIYEYLVKKLVKKRKGR